VGAAGADYLDGGLGVLGYLGQVVELQKPGRDADAVFGYTTARS
jgi:hypothetical protein